MPQWRKDGADEADTRAWRAPKLRGVFVSYVLTTHLLTHLHLEGHVRVLVVVGLMEALEP